MKLLFDFLPIILFFVAFKVAEGDTDAAAAFATEHFGFMVSGGVGRPRRSAGAAGHRGRHRRHDRADRLAASCAAKVEPMQWVSLALIVVFGGATIWPTTRPSSSGSPRVLYWLMGAALLVGQAAVRARTCSSR